MDRDHAAPPIENASAPLPPAAELNAAADVTRQQLRNDLIAAADEEAAAIVEEARREITATVRRARRDLLLIRAQLRLCGVEPRELQAPDWDERPPVAALNGAVPHDALVVGRTHALRHAVTAAASELDGLSGTPSAAATEYASLPTERWIAEGDPPAVGPLPATAPEPAIGASRPRHRTVAAAGLLLLVAGAVVIWAYAGRRDLPPTTVDSPVDAPAASVTGAGQNAAERSTSPAGRPEPEPASVPRVTLQTLRTVWMRIEVDGETDTGRVYPAGTTKTFNPQGQFVVRAGDAGAVLLAVGDAPPAALGRDGQVITRRVSFESSAATNAERTPHAEPAPAAAAPERPPIELLPAPTVVNGRRLDPPAVGSSTETVPPIRSDGLPAAASTLASPALPTKADDAAPPQQDPEILARHAQWLDAYARGDQNALRRLTADGFSMKDERRLETGTAGRILPAHLSDIRIDVAGVGAVLTARVRTPGAGASGDALLSEVWVRGSQQQWALMGVRITPIDQTGNVPERAGR